MDRRRTIRKCLKTDVISADKAFWRCTAAEDWSGQKEEMAIVREGKERDSRRKRRGTITRLEVEGGGEK